MATRQPGGLARISQGPEAQPPSRDAGNNLPAAKICFLADLTNPTLAARMGAVHRRELVKRQ